MNFDLPSIFEGLKNGAIDAAKTAGEAFIKEAAGDAVAFVNLAAPKIGRYLELLNTNQINADEFKSLMLGLRDLAEMAALTEAGLAAIEVDKTRNTILKAVTGIALGALGKIA